MVKQSLQKVQLMIETSSNFNQHLLKAYLNIFISDIFKLYNAVGIQNHFSDHCMFVRRRISKMYGNNFEYFKNVPLLTGMFSEKPLNAEWNLKPSNIV